MRAAGEGARAEGLLGLMDDLWQTMAFDGAGAAHSAGAARTATLLASASGCPNIKVPSPA